MAHPNMYMQQAQGTLVAGQIIAVNKYTVQVERFLSQGGFAHVYLVRTAEPVFNTTHHVLKRIAVQNEAMLNEVKKEVDIMRILRGHPNIVYLIDAAWHKMAEGTYEVFILMEFCPGGGIIDMMNRRLRERLTEADILQIFVDVCEGVAAMHNLRPPLLHRDLKVENILQASETSFKLCDFGSATPVATRPPSSAQELRALEADLNRHTTLQYRPPEMVDVYLRRPVDEKSDVWALGVLLYKLCYYTTPFEEHGILAILNVQYKIPPYPVYSKQLNALIASMLREHGSQRPTVFELLDSVHKMRGTRSKFTYNPPPAQPLSPRIAIPGPQLQPKNNTGSISSSRNNAIQARDVVLQAIAPMRQDRPSTPSQKATGGDYGHSPVLGNRGQWPVAVARAHKSGLASISAGEIMRPTKLPSMPVSSNSNDAWRVPHTTEDKSRSPAPQPTRTANGFGDSFDGKLRDSTHRNVARVPPPQLSDTKPKLYGFSVPANGDAFDSLSMFLTPKPQAMTLGEAQKAMAKTSPTPSPKPSERPLPSPVPSLHTKLQSPSLSGSSNYSFQPKATPPLPKSRLGDQAIAAEHRFPSLEELDAHLGASSGSASPAAQPPLPPRPQHQPSLPPRPSASEKSAVATQPTSSGIGASWKSILNTPISGVRQDGVRSQQVTGTAMRESRERPQPQRMASSSSFRSQERALPDPPPSIPTEAKPELAAPRATRRTETRDGIPIRPMVIRKHRSSISVKSPEKQSSNLLSPTEGNEMAERDLMKATDTKFVSPIATAFPPPKDWLTGDDSVEAPIPKQVTLRASPEKRASVSMSPVPFEKPLEATHGMSPKKSSSRFLPGDDDGSFTGARPDASSSIAKSWERAGASVESKDSSDEEGGPEDAEGLPQASKGIQPRRTHNARQSSVHELVDLYGGSVNSERPPVPPKSEKRRSVIMPSSSSSATDSPASKKSGLPSTTPTDKWVKSTITPLKPSVERKPVPVRRVPSLSSGSSAPPSPARAKSRPQSMLILPMSKAVSDSLASPRPVSPSLQPPPDLNKVRSAGRRSSISEMVSRYEAIEANAAGAGTSAVNKVAAQEQRSPPPASLKPARLKATATNAITSPGSISSPTAASFRFPRISPTSSPSKSAFGSSLTVKSNTTTATERKRSPSPVKRKPSPSPSLIDEQDLNLTKPVLPELPDRSPSPTRRAGTTRSILSPTPIRRVDTPAQVELRKTIAPSPAVRGKTSSSSASTSSPVEEIHPRLINARPPSPDRSPERPFPGVSKLIDQWQKKTEEVDRDNKPFGAPSRFRREGLVSAGNKDT